MITMPIFSLKTGVYVAVAAVALYFLKGYMRGPAYNGDERMDNKVVIITGANTGIGKETARDLVARGARVIMACRDLKRCRLAEEEIYSSTEKHAHCMQMDLSSFASIHAFAKDFNSNFDRLDVLINNAGVMFTPKLETSDGLEMQSGVNHFGHFLLTKLLLDNLKTSAPSRIIVVSSRAHWRGEIDLKGITGSEDYNRITAYGQSKLANVLFSNELSRRLSGSGVTVNSLHPGVIDTELTRYTPVVNTWIVELFLMPVKYIFFKTPKDGAQTTIRLAVDPNLSEVTGKYFSDCEEAPVSALALDQQMAKKLWDLSETVTDSKL